MKRTLRCFCASLLVSVMAVCLPLPGHAQSFPAKPVRFVVPYSAGGAPDLLMRMLGDSLTQMWGQAVFVENRPGAAGILAMTDFKKSPPDGYSYIFAEVGILAINPSYYKSLPYDPERDLQPVIDLSSNPWVLLTAKDGPIKSMRSLVELAKANPGKFTYASPGTGTPIFGASELLKLRAGINLLHVPFKETSQILASLARGEVNLFFTSMWNARAVQDRVIALGVASKRRMPEFPDIPTIEEAGGPAGFDVSAWGMLVAPRGVPAAIIGRVRADAVRALQRPEMLQKLASFGLAGTEEKTPEELAKFIRSEAARYREVIEATGARVD